MKTSALFFAASSMALLAYAASGVEKAPAEHLFRRQSPSPSPTPTPMPPNNPISRPCTNKYVDGLLYNTALDDFVATYNSNDADQKYPSCNWNLANCYNPPTNVKPFLQDFQDACFRLDFGRRNTAIQGRYDSVKAALHGQFQKDLYDICDNRMTEPQESLCEGAAAELFRYIDHVAVGDYDDGQYNADSPTRTQYPFPKKTTLLGQ